MKGYKEKRARKRLFKSLYFAAGRTGVYSRRKKARVRGRKIKADKKEMCLAHCVNL